MVVLHAFTIVVSKGWEMGVTRANLVCVASMCE